MFLKSIRLFVQLTSQTWYKFFKTLWMNKISNLSFLQIRYIFSQGNNLYTRHKQSAKYIRTYVPDSFVNLSPGNNNNLNRDLNLFFDSCINFAIVLGVQIFLKTDVPLKCNSIDALGAKSFDNILCWGFFWTTNWTKPNKTLYKKFRVSSWNISFHCIFISITFQSCFLS